MIKSYNIIGLMSGTSIDGLDIAYCNFAKTSTGWSYCIKQAQTMPYPTTLKSKLKNATNISGLKLVELDWELGRYFGEKTTAFINKYKLKPNFISSHGHTVFHQPENGFTHQIGNGESISKICKLPVINNFRALDIAYNGQGAPLVPIGDELLFNKYDACLNLGGFANISYQNNSIRIAYDICAVNIVLNFLANKLDFSFDKNGELAQQGKVNQALLTKLNQIPYYTLQPPKSLGKEWVEKIIFPIFDAFSNISDYDKLHTYTEHISSQISHNLQNKNNALITGGGAYNKFLINKIKDKTNAQLIVPDSLLIDFKEALIFAFLGLLRIKKQTNCLASVTGSAKDLCSGNLIGF